MDGDYTCSLVTPSSGTIDVQAVALGYVLQADALARHAVFVQVHDDPRVGGCLDPANDERVGIDLLFVDVQGRELLRGDVAPDSHGTLLGCVRECVSSKGEQRDDARCDARDG